MSIKTLTKELQALGLLDLAQKRGCTPDEIRTLELRYSVRLPDAYRAFLEEFGYGGADIFDPLDVDFRYPNVLDITAYVRDYRARLEKRMAELCEKEGVEPGADDKLSPLPERSLFVANRNGMDFQYIIAAGGEDCAVYSYSTDTDAGMDTQSKIYDSIWDWLTLSARATGALRSELRDQRSRLAAGSG